MSELMKRVLISCLVLCMVFLPVYAEEELSAGVSGYRVTVSGSADSGAGANVTVMIVRPGKDVTAVVRDAEATAKNLFNNTVSYTAQTPVDENRHFECVCPFDQDEKSGIFTARVKISGETDVRETEFTFVNEARRQAAEAAINDCTDKTKTEAFLSEYASDVDVEAGGSYDGFTSAERAYVIGKVTNAKSGKSKAFGDAVEEIDSVRELKSLERAALKAAVDNGSVTGVDKSLLSDYSALSKTKKNQFAADFYSGIQTASTPEDIKAAFSKALTEAKKEESGGSSGGSSGRSCACPPPSPCEASRARRSCCRISETRARFLTPSSTSKVSRGV